MVSLERPSSEPEGSFDPVWLAGCREEMFEGMRIRVVLARPERALPCRWGAICVAKSELIRAVRAAAMF